MPCIVEKIFELRVCQFTNIEKEKKIYAYRDPCLVQSEIYLGNDLLEFIQTAVSSILTHEQPHWMWTVHQQILQVWDQRESNARHIFQRKIGVSWLERIPPPYLAISILSWIKVLRGKTNIRIAPIIKTHRIGFRPRPSPARLQNPVEIALRTLMIVTTANSQI